MDFPFNERPPRDTKAVSQYRGRFAPSPSGFLHFGSLVAALASYLHAKHHNGVWLVRIEDIDPPREKEGASSAILKTLESFGLHWDESVLFQSNQSNFYQQVLSELKLQQQTYHCQCTRAEIKAVGGIYQGKCRNLALPSANNSTRLINHHGIFQYQDLLQGNVICDQALAQEDFILLRKDGLFAYQLAAVVDDIYQNITHVIRGCDLLEPTARQLSFFKQLNIEPPQYGHIPLAVTGAGFKLSKQNKAPSIDNNNPAPALMSALEFLGQHPPAALINENAENIIHWATLHWSTQSVPKQQQIIFSDE
jgi:glutamyl-Q tRNA(Asp) synthetase